MAKVKKPHNGPPASELDLESLAAIRDLLAQEDQKRPRRVAKQAQDETDAPQYQASRAFPRRVVAAKSRVRGQQKTEQVSEAPQINDQTGPVRAGESATQRTRRAFKGLRYPKTSILVAGLVLMIVLYPWHMLALIFVASFLIASLFLVVGYDGFWRGVMNSARWYARRHPSRSDELHRKLDAFAMKFDAVLDRFPEGSVDGLYLPDFGDLAKAEARHGAALDRRFDDMSRPNA